MVYDLLMNQAELYGCIQFSSILILNVSKIQIELARDERLTI